MLLLYPRRIGRHISEKEGWKGLYWGYCCAEESRKIHWCRLMMCTLVDSACFSHCTEWFSFLQSSQHQTSFLFNTRTIVARRYVGCVTFSKMPFSSKRCSSFFTRGGNSSGTRLAVCTVYGWVSSLRVILTGSAFNRWLILNTVLTCPTHFTSLHWWLSKLLLSFNHMHRKCVFFASVGSISS